METIKIDVMLQNGKKFCPYPERDRCEGCPRYIEDEDICDLEIG